MRKVDFFNELIRDRRLRTMSRAATPFGDLSSGISNIEADRKAIARQAFKDIDILHLSNV